MHPQDRPVPLDQLGPGGAVLDPAEDVRGLEVLDSFGRHVGRVEELLIDGREKRVRLMRVGTTRERLVRTCLVPVDAVSRITDRDVTVDRVRAHVEAGPPEAPGAPDQRHLERVYAHYGYYPYWEPGYVYPSYPAYP